MGEYRTNTAELLAAVRQLITKVAEMEAAVAAVERKMQPARSHKAPVVERIVSDWDAVKKSLKTDFVSSKQLSSTLQKTARAIDDVMH